MVPTDPKPPVVLVHGWRSHPGIWNRLAPVLSDLKIPLWNFDHTALQNVGTETIALALRDYIHEKRVETGYAGPVDIVCHSMGTGIARYLLEVIDGGGREEEVRMLVGIGPPNNGSAMAELFNDPERSSVVIRSLQGVFVPEDYDPHEDTIVQEFRPRSKLIATLRAAGTRDDIAYRIILGANLTGTPAFFPVFDGRTWEIAPDGSWQTTYAGDGIVPHSESFLSGAEMVVLPGDSSYLARNPEHYCHTLLPRNSETIARIRDYLISSAEPAVRTPSRN
ncbi:MAG: alpha/beta fold hydrolase [Methanoculleus sp.]